MKKHLIKLQTGLSADTILVWSLIVCTSIFFCFRIAYHNDFIFDKFIDRDLLRAILGSNHFFSFGAELNGGGRTPGGFLNIFLKLSYSIANNSISGMYIIYCFIHFMTAAALFFVCKKYISNLSALAVIFFYIVNYLVFETYLTIWNPTLGFCFVVFATCLLPLIIIDQRYFLLPILYLILGLATQLHLSNAMYILAITILFILMRVKIPIKFIILSCLVLIGIYLPFLLSLNKDVLFFKSLYVSPFLDWSVYLYRFLVVICNLMGVIVFSPNESLQWIARTNFESSLFYSYRYLLVIGSAFPTLFLIYALTQKPSKDIRVFQILKYLSLINLALIFPVLILSYDNEYIAIRRFLWILPAQIILAAFGFSNFFNKIKINNHKYMIFIGIIFYTFVQIIYVKQNQIETLSPELYSFKKEIIQIAKDKLNYTDYDIQSKIGLITKHDFTTQSNKWEIKNYYSHDGSGLSSLLNDSLKLDNLTEPRNCLMVIRDNDESLFYYKNKNLDYFLKEIVRAPEIVINSVFKGKYGIYIDYKPVALNCISYFKNYYFLPEKNHIMEIFNNKNFENTYLNQFYYDNNLYYLILKMKQMEDYLLGQIFISTQELDKFNGIGYHFDDLNFIYNSQIIFSNLKSEINHEISYNLFNFNDAQKLALTIPLYFKIPRPPNGLYNVKLKGFSKNGYAKDIPIINNYIIK